MTIKTVKYEHRYIVDDEFNCNITYSETPVGNWFWSVSTTSKLTVTTTGIAWTREQAEQQVIDEINRRGFENEMTP